MQSFFIDRLRSFAYALRGLALLVAAAGAAVIGVPVFTPHLTGR